MKKQIIGAKIVTPESILEGKTLIFDEKIIDISDSPVTDAETINCDDKYVIPGLIDLHIHGYLNADASDGDDEALRRMSAGIFENGVTAYLPTTMTLPYDLLESAFNSARRLRAERRSGEAEILGVHAEGPFINPEKKGAMKPDYIKTPDADFVIANKDIIKMITIAPETAKDMSELTKIAENGVVVSMGHTSADFNTAKAGFAAGITHATHLFNAMSSITHREPGAAGAALFSPEVSCELICDTFHVHPALFAPVWKLKGDKLTIITDCMRAGGMPDGEFDLGGQMVTVSGIKCLLPSGTIAGSVLKMNHAVKNLRDAGVPFHEAVNAASINPAKAIGVQNELGAIIPGLKADLCICDFDMNIFEVYKSGVREF